MKQSDINLRDPFVLCEGGRQYLFGTEGANAWSGRADGFFVYENIGGDWERKRAFSPPANFWSEENFWAPEVHKIGGKFIMFATFWSKSEGRRVHLLQSDAPCGPYLPLPEPLTPAGMMCLDATYFEEDGKRWTVFCHEWTQIKDGAMMLAPLDDGLRMGEPRLLFHASEAPWTRSFGEGCYVTDGPFLYRLKSGLLLMLWSSNAEGGYATGMAVAERIEGPWRHIPEPLLKNGAGHAMIFFEGGPMLAYHAPDSPNGSERPVFLPLGETPDRLFLK